MGMITGLELNKRQAAIYVDGTLFLRLKRSDYDKLPLTEGDELDENEYIDRLSAIQSKRAYESALDLLSRQDITAEGLVKSLQRRGFMEPVARAVSERLVENGLINDDRYAQRYVELHQNSHVGRYALARKLRGKGIDPDTAKAALEELDDEAQLASATELARQLARRYEGDDPRAARAKLSQALARRGYAWDIISAALERAGMDDDDFDE